MNRRSKDIVLVTCKSWPNLSDGDAALADELTALGHQVRSRPWNDAPVADFTSADLVVLRSNWDYHHDLDAFIAWLDLVDAGDAELRNPAGLVRSCLDKAIYLGDLAAAGFRTPLTLATAGFETEADTHRLLDWVDEHGLASVVVKPAWGASGHGVELVDRGDLVALAARWRDDPARRPLLVQEFMAEVGDGEIGLVYFAGRFSHALQRRAAAGDFRVNGQYGGSATVADEVPSHLIEFGAEVEASLAERPTYARIDVVSDGEDHTVMEVEVNEPGLGLHLAPGSAARFAAALLDQPPR